MTKHVHHDPLQNDAFTTIPTTNIWYEALLDACMVAHVGVNEGDPRKTIHDLITWHVQVALDPLVSGATPAIPADWKLVPVAPTREMCTAGQRKAREWPRFPLRIGPIYEAMIAAAPTKEST